MKATGKALLLALKFLLTTSLITWVAIQADWQSIAAMLAGADARMLAAAVVFQVVSFVLMNVRWWCLLGHLASETRLLHTSGSFYLGLFGNNFLPTGMGGDLLKILRMRSPSLSGKSLLAASVMDRVVGLAGVLMIGTAALYFFTPPMLQGTPRSLLLVILVAIPIGFLTFYSTPAANLLQYLETRFHAHRLIIEILHTLRQLQAFRHAGWRLVQALVLTLMLQSMVALCYAMLGLALGSQVEISAYFVMIPILFIATGLPVSIGGLGIREGTFVTLMVASGMAQQTAIGVSILYLALLLALTVPGGLVLLNKRQAA